MAKQIKTATKTATSTSTFGQLKQYWPTLGNWPKALGAMPALVNIELANKFNRAGTAVSMAWALYARHEGASDNEAAIAARAATGSQSASHRVKLDQAVKAGLVNRTVIGKRDGHTVYRIELASKPASKPASKSAASKPASKSAASKPASKSAASKPASKPASKSAASKPASKPASAAASKPASKPASDAAPASKPVE